MNVGTKRVYQGVLGTPQIERSKSWRAEKNRASASFIPDRFKYAISLPAWGLSW